MANATKYFAEFKDLNGQQWRINIHDSEFAGTTPTEFNCGQSGFVISYKGDTENIFQPIVGSSIEFEFVETTSAHTAFLAALATATESRFTITIQKWISGAYQLHWFGVLLSDQWSQTNEPLPRSSMLTASDDLGNLNSILYKSDASTAYTGNATMTRHLMNALTKTRALHQFDSGSPFIRIVDDFRAANMTATNRFMDNIRTHHESFWNVDDDGQRQFMSSFDVVKNICKSQNARLFLADGTFWFVPIGAYQNNTELTWHNYDVSGSYLSTSSANEMAISASTDLPDLAGNVARFTPPLSEAKRTREYNGNAPVIWQPYVAQNVFTNTINDFGVDYFVGQQINLIGTVNVTLPAVDPAFGSSDADERVGRIAIGVQFKCGNQYATAPITFGGQGNFGFDDGTTGTYQLANYGVLSWSTSAGSTQFLSEPFDRNAGTNQNIGLVFTTGQLPSTQSSLQITLSIALVEYDGTFVAIDSGLNVADSPEYFGQNIRAFRADADGGGSEITYTAAGDETNRAIKTDDVVVLGDRISDSERGVLSVWDGSSYTDATGWTSTNYTGSGVGINRLAVNEILRTMKFPVRVLGGSFHVNVPSADLVSFANVIDIDSGTYIFTEFTFRVNDQILEFELAEIVRSTDAITEVVSDKKNISTDVVPTGFDPSVEMNGLSNAIGSTTTAIANLESTTAAIEAKTDLISISQPVDLDDMESDIGTNTTSISGINQTLAILKGTFQPKGDDGNTITKVVYQDDKTDGLEMTLTPTTAAFTSNSGNSQLSITESSPGVFRVDLQDDTTNSVLALYATASSNVHFVGIGTSSPSYQLDVVGRINATNGILVNGSPVGSLNNVVEDTTPQLGGDLDAQTYDLDVSGGGSLISGGDQYVFKYLTTNYGLYFNLTSPGFEFRNASGTAIFRLAAGNGEMTICNNYTMPVADGSANQLLKTDGAGNIDFTTLSIDDLSDVDTSSVAPTTNQVLKWDGSKWSPADDDTSGGGGGSNSFNTISVSGQSNVVADSGNDTLTLVAGSNVAITTNATTDSITFAVSATPSFTSILTSGNITALGAIAAIGNISSNGNVSAGGQMTAGGDLNVMGNATITGDLFTTNLNFIGGGTSVIGISNAGGNEPDDLEIRSNGNVVVVLDHDNDESDQAFEIKSGDGTIILRVNESGISSGLFTTATPTIATIADFESTQTGTISVINYDAATTYLVQLFDSSNNVVNHTITDNNDGTWTIASGLSVGSNYYVTIQSVGFGQLVSATATSNTFDCLAAQTQKRYWRLQMTDSNKNPVASNVALGTFALFTGSNGSGTKWPTSFLTSNTTPSPFVASGGYAYSATYDFWRAFDAGGNSAGSMWWTLGISNAANNYIQIDLGQSVNMASAQIATSGGWTSANYAVLYGSDTGAFSGEEREMAFFQNIDTAGQSGGTFSTFTMNIT